MSYGKNFNTKHFFLSCIKNGRRPGKKAITWSRFCFGSKSLFPSRLFLALSPIRTKLARIIHAERDTAFGYIDADCSLSHVVPTKCIRNVENTIHPSVLWIPIFPSHGVLTTSARLPGCSNKEFVNILWEQWAVVRNGSSGKLISSRVIFALGTSAPQSVAIKTTIQVISKQTYRHILILLSCDTEIRATCDTRNE